MQVNTSTPLSAVAEVEIEDGLVCIKITRPHSQEVVIRLPRNLAVTLGTEITKAARSAPNSWVSQESDTPQAEEKA